MNRSRSAIQNHVYRLIETEMRYRPEEDDAPYKLSPLGVWMATLADRSGPVLAEAETAIAEAEAAVAEDYADVPGLSEETREDIINERKWRHVDDVGAALEQALRADVGDEGGRRHRH